MGPSSLLKKSSKGDPFRHHSFRHQPRGDRHRRGDVHHRRADLFREIREGNRGGYPRARLRPARISGKGARATPPPQHEGDGQFQRAACGLKNGQRLRFTSASPWDASQPLMGGRRGWMARSFAPTVIATQSPHTACHLRVKPLSQPAGRGPKRRRRVPQSVTRQIKRRRGPSGTRVDGPTHRGIRCTIRPTGARVSPAVGQNHPALSTVTAPAETARQAFAMQRHGEPGGAKTGKAFLPQKDAAVLGPGGQRGRAASVWSILPPLKPTAMTSGAAIERRALSKSVVS